ncbi:MAG: BPL-N domain-containing protein [Chthoniobacteraceae bacterium]
MSYLHHLAALALLAVAASAAEPQPIRVALYDDKGAAGKGVPSVTEQLGKAADIKVTKVKGADLASGLLKDFDVVVFTGGSGHAEADAVTEKGREEVRQFVRGGGGYVGICAGAYLACSGFSWGIGVLNAKTVSPKWRRGVGEVQIEATPIASETVGFTAEKRGIRYANGPIITPDSREDLPAYEPLAHFRTELAENESPAGAMINTPAIVRAKCGKGRVITSSPHPEQTAGMEGFIEQAVRWVAHRGN